MNSDLIYSKAVNYFAKVVEHGSVSKAAKNMHVSQSTISVAIQNLEDDLNYDLLIRGRGKTGVRLTTKGQALFDFLKSQHQILATLDRTTPNSEPLKVAAIQYVACNFLVPALDIMKQKSSTRIYSVRSDQAVEAIKKGKMDLAFIVSQSRPLRDKDYCIQIKEESVGVVGLKSKFPELSRAKSV